MTRTAILGGESAARGLLGGGRSKSDNRLRYTCGVVAVITWYVVGGIVGVAIAAVIFLAGVLLTTHLISGATVLSSTVMNVRWWLRSRKRLNEFIPAYVPEVDVAEIAPAETTDGPPTAEAADPEVNEQKRGLLRRKRKPIPVRSVPDAIGTVREMVYEAPAGGEVAVLVHTRPGRTHYLSAVLEVEGHPSGIYEQEDIDASAERFGRLLASCGGPTSLIGGIQLLTRVVPVDSAEHEWFVLQNRSELAPSQLVESYGQLLAQARQSVEQYRNYLIASFPLRPIFSEVARDFGDPAKDEVRCALVHEEMSRIGSLAASAGMRPVTMLGPGRLAALIRSLQDPDFYIDEIEDVDWQNCWQRSRATRKHVVTNDKWATRIAKIPPNGVSLDPVHMRWLSPLLIGVQPAVIRTLSMHIQLEPARKARAQARRDVAEDRGKILAAAKQGKVTDMTDQGALTASQQRLLDLRAGTGHAGLRWGMYLSITTHENMIRRASDVILDRAGDAGIVDLAWMDGVQDLAQPAVWPLGRGLN